MSNKIYVVYGVDPLEGDAYMKEAFRSEDAAKAKYEELAEQEIGNEFFYSYEEVELS
jgi:hypothetical protein